MRFLELTSPLMRGADVTDFQHALNKYLNQWHLTPVKTDGQYGPESRSACHNVAWRLGLGTLVAVPAVQRVIEGKRPRMPADLIRAKKRANSISSNSGLQAILENGLKYIGIHEEPPGSNVGYPYPSDWEKNFGMNGVSWCGCFYGSMAQAAGARLTSRVAYCPFIEADAKTGANGFTEWTTDHNKVQPGWAVLYCWNGSGVPEHVGIVESFTPAGPISVEGNTGGINPSDGGMVARMQRTFGEVVGYAKPRI